MQNRFDGLISLKDVAEILGKDESTIRKYIKNGRFKEGVDCSKFGKQWVFDLERIKDFKAGD